MKALSAATVFAVLAAVGPVKADPVSYTVTATATLSQFDTSTSQTFTGSGDPVATLPSVSVSLGDGTSTASASATARVLTAGFSTANTGLDIHSAQAGTSGGGIAFVNDAAYQSLFGAGALITQVLLNFDFSYTAQTDNIRSSNAQATVSDHFSIFVQGSGTWEGSVSVLNDGFSHTATGYNLLTGLGEGSGERRVSVPVNLTVFNPLLRWNAEVDTGGLAVQDGFAIGQATLSLPAARYALTTVDGTPLTDLGVQFDFVPPTTDDDPTSVPEPNSVALLGFGLAVLALATARHPDRHPNHQWHRRRVPAPPLARPS